MAPSATAPSYKRTLQEELLLRCLLVESAHQDYAVRKVQDMLGEERAERQVPISLAANPTRRALGVTAILYDLCAVYGVSDRLAELLGEMEAPITLERYAKAGLRPMPQGMIEGGYKGGLRDALEYLQICEFVVVFCGWAPRPRRPFVQVGRPCDTRVTYASDDPYTPIRVELDHQRDIGGKSKDVTDVWDMLEPSLTVHLAGPDGKDVTAEVDDLSQAHADGGLSGDGFWWRWRTGERVGQPYFPGAVYGHTARTPRSAQLAEGSLEACVVRTSAMSASLDGGFPERSVRGLETAEDVSLNPGDVRVYKDSDETRPGTFHEFGPGADPEMMWRNARAVEADILSSLGYPVDYTQTGGEPLAHEVEARTRAIRRWFGICRAGDVKLLEVLAAISGKALDEGIAESGYSAMYLAEVEEALGGANTTSGSEDGDDRRGTGGAEDEDPDPGKGAD